VAKALVKPLSKK
jgi:hypothetical protein